MARTIRQDAGLAIRSRGQLGAGKLVQGCLCLFQIVHRPASPAPGVQRHFSCRNPFHPSNGRKNRTSFTVPCGWRGRRGDRESRGGVDGKKSFCAARCNHELAVPCPGAFPPPLPTPLPFLMTLFAFPLPIKTAIVLLALPTETFSKPPSQRGLRAT